MQAKFEMLPAVFTGNETRLHQKMNARCHFKTVIMSVALTLSLIHSLSCEQFTQRGICFVLYQ